MLTIGLAFTLKPADRGVDEDGPDDRFEEFDWPETIEAIAEAIRGDGHQVRLLGDGREFLQAMLADPPDFVFNIAEGRGVGRDREARVPAVCEMLGVPYSGSDPLTLSLALDKDLARRVVALSGVACPEGFVVFEDADTDILEQEIAFLLGESESKAVILKPNSEGSSKGIRGTGLAKDLGEAMDLYRGLARDYAQPVVIEEFIDGEELTVGVLGNGGLAEVLGIMRVVPKARKGPFVYSLDVKRDWKRRVTYEAPASLPPDDLENLAESARLAYEALSCRDLARIDFRVSDGVAFFIEANPLPGLAPVTSDLVILAEGYGIGHEDLICRILRIALRRVGLIDRAAS